MALEVRKRTPFLWSSARITAAMLLAEDALSDAEIAIQVGVSRAAITKWKRHPEFTDRIRQHQREREAAVSRFSIAKRRERMRILDELLTGLLQVVESRGTAYAGEAPGSGTGLLTRTEQRVGSGKHQQVIVTFTLDTGLLREVRALLKQAAQDMGQWNEKALLVQTSGIRREYVVMHQHGENVDITDEAAMTDVAGSALEHLTFSLRETETGSEA